MTFKNVLVTGGNRGIGLEYVKQFVSAGYKVFATTRSLDSPDLNALAQSNPGKVEVKQLDVTDMESIAALAKSLENVPLEIVVNNAGYLTTNDLNTVTPTQMVDEFKINALGPLFVSRALLPNVRLAKSMGGNCKIVHITSRMGSISDNGSGGYYAYRASKSALNSITKSLAVDLEQEGITVLLLHPGYIKTRMTGGKGEMEADESVSRQMKVIEKATIQDAGKFFHRDGQVIPW